MLESEQPLIRPANYPPSVPGKGSVIIEIKGHRIAVLNLQGRKNLGNIDCPFRVGLEHTKKLKNKSDIIIIDFSCRISRRKRIPWDLSGWEGKCCSRYSYPCSDRR